MAQPRVRSYGLWEKATMFIIQRRLEKHHSCRRTDPAPRRARQPRRQLLHLLRLLPLPMLSQPHREKITMETIPLMRWFCGYGTGCRWRRRRWTGTAGFLLLVTVLVLGGIISRSSVLRFIGFRVFLQTLFELPFFFDLGDLFGTETHLLRAWGANGVRAITELCCETWIADRTRKRAICPVRIRMQVMCNGTTIDRVRVSMAPHWQRHWALAGGHCTLSPLPARSYAVRRRKGQPRRSKQITY